LTSFYGKTGFPGGEEILNCGRASSAGGKVIRPTQSALCTTAVGSESLYSWFN